ncbi:MFS transporter [Candidatus Omnitrophota bacterium]
MREMRNSGGRKAVRGISVISWALYDLANQFFALIIVSLYFPRWISLEKGVPEIFYSLAFGVSMFLVAVSAPVLGAVADAKQKRKAFLVYFTLLSVVFTISLSLPVNVFWALVFFAIANVGCQGAIVFYNALMVDVAPRGRAGLVSGLGRMFGYTGAILALYLTKPVILNAGYRATFLITGILFFIFSLPCIIFVKETRHEESPGAARFLEGKGFAEVYKKLREMFISICEIEGFQDFLKASFFALCAVNTIILFMFVYAAKVFGLGEERLINLVAFSALFAIGGSLIAGFVSDLGGYRRSLMGVFFLWGVCIIGGALLSLRFVLVLGALAGLSLGSTWVVLRALVVRIVPEEMMGKAFGLFNLVNYLSAIVGPVFWGLILLYLSRLGEWGYRMAFFSLILFIITGIVFLFKMGKKLEPIRSEQIQ